MSHFVIPRGGGEPFPLLLDTGFCTRYDEKGLNYFFNPDFPLENNPDFPLDDFDRIN